MPKKVVRTAHSSSGENDVYRLWMATEVHGKLCVYGDYRGRSHSFLCNLKSKLYFFELIILLNLQPEPVTRALV